MNSKASKIRRRWWLLYTLGIVLTLTALLAGTSIIISLDRTAQRAAALADRQASLRLALWRLDAWLSPLLFQESARPYFVYQSLYSTSRVNTENQSFENRIPSPLLNFDSDFIPIHFQVSPARVPSSPQLPSRAEATVLRSYGLEPKPDPQAQTLLNQITSVIDNTEFIEYIQLAESNAISNILASQNAQADFNHSADEASTNANADDHNATVPQQSRTSRQQFDSGKRSVYQQQALVNQSKGAANILEQNRLLDLAPPDAPTISIGPFMPIWLASKEPAAAPLLAYIRRVHIDKREYQQGFILDWQAVTQAMQNEITDLFPSATLAPVYTIWGSTDPPDLALAVLPAILVVPELAFTPANLSTPTRVTLFLTYLMVILAVTAVGFALHGGITFGDKRNRFASAVTHELRTPLTTFRMYSEMLAQDMVPPSEQKAYLITLEREARRLESLVNNVLAYARLEEGRPHLNQSTKPQSASEILERFLPNWQSRAADAGLILEFNSNLNSTHTIQADPEAVGQIIFNLIENACKYAQSENNPTIQLNATATNKTLTITITDHGPGIDPSTRKRLFKPFERGNGDPAKPGLGLGLALSRSLARDFGGDLILDTNNPATTFRLTLPLTNAGR